MNWKNPKTELPEEGRIVAVLMQHWKEHNPLSCEIMFGEVQWANDRSSCCAQTGDMSGKGSWSVFLHFKHDEYPYQPDDMGIAWMYVEDFKLPDWVQHDKHWGPK